jgi:sigma-B regulation protein RsbU (phosphoserine phosphatase)
MASARSVVRANVALHNDPASALRHANEVLCAEAPNGMFVTLLLARISRASGKVVFANAGNNCPLLYRGASGDFADVGTSGFPLGIDSDFRYISTEAELAPGDFLLFYTDGLTDANDPKLDFFGRDRLLEALRVASRLPAAEMRDRLRSAVADFIGTSAPYDDVTFIIARRTAS